jgi:hypothetical protein
MEQSNIKPSYHSLSEIGTRFGGGRDMARSLINNGLPVIKRGNMIMITERSILDWIDTEAKKEQEKTPN